MKILLIFIFLNFIIAQIEMMSNHSCNQTFTCFRLNLTDYENILTKCANEISNCDSNCQSHRTQFKNCTEKNCECIDDVFSWKCLDNCRDESRNPDFANLVNCVYIPCRPIEEKFSWFIPILISFLIILLICVSCIIWRCKKNRNEEIRERMNFSINEASKNTF